MQYRRVGSSGLKVSALSIGGWLTFGNTVDQDTSKQILRRAIDAGVNFIDLADIYSKGEAEKVVGAALTDLPRDRLVLSSKLFWPMSDDPNDRGLSRKHIKASIERTLRNLRTDYLDIYFCHREDPETPLEETARAMNDLVQQGKILYWGTSMFRPKTLLKLHAIANVRNLVAPIVEQPEYSLLQRSIEKRLMPVTRRLGTGLVVWSPLAGGILTGKYNEGVPSGSRGASTKWLDHLLTDANLARARKLSSLAKDLNIEPGQLAIAWILRRKEVSSVITGASTVAQFESNLKALTVDVPGDTLERVDRLFA